MLLSARKPPCVHCRLPARRLRSQAAGRASGERRAKHSTTGCPASISRTTSPSRKVGEGREAHPLPPCINRYFLYLFCRRLERNVKGLTHERRRHDLARDRLGASRRHRGADGRDGPGRRSAAAPRAQVLCQGARGRAARPIFAARIGDWGPHLEKMVAFWSSVALMTGACHGRPAPAQMGLPVTWALFERWLGLVRETVREIWSPAGADHVIGLTPGRGLAAGAAARPSILVDG